MPAVEKSFSTLLAYAVRRAKGKSGAAAQVVANQWLGDQTHIAAAFAGSTVVLVEHDRADISMGDTISVELKPEDLHFFDPASGAAISHGTQMA